MQHIRVVARGEDAVIPFAQDLIMQSKEVIGACKRCGRNSPDLEDMQHSLSALERAFVTIR
jgi:hypothetical protein